MPTVGEIEKFGQVHCVDIEQRTDLQEHFDLYEVTTVVSIEGSLDPAFYHYVREVDGRLYDTSDNFDFDGDIRDTIFTPLATLPREETKDELERFFNIDLSHIVISIDANDLFAEKYKSGCVWSDFFNEFMPKQNATTSEIAAADKMAEQGWDNAPLHKPSVAERPEPKAEAAEAAFDSPFYSDNTENDKPGVFMPPLIG